MPAALITHPFEIRISGRVATAEQGTDRYIESQIAMAVGTRLGERDMAPSYGVAAMADLAASDIQTVLDDHGPDGVTVTAITRTQVSDSTETITVEWAAE